MTPQERIKADAEAYANGIGDVYRKYAARYGYIAGATATHDRAKVLVDLIKDLYNAYGDEWTGYYKEKVESALEQWEGKEVANPCPRCGKELYRDRNLCCRECGKEVGDE